MKMIIYMLMLTLTMSCDLNKELKPLIKNSEDLMNITIHNKKENNDLKNILLKKYIDTITYIGLKTSTDNLISEVSKIFLSDNILIIFDYKSDQVFFFDRKGNFLNKIFKKGRANNEYLSIATGLYDSTNNYIIIYDNTQYKLLFYDLNGNYIKSVKNFNDNCVIRDLINLSDGSFLCYRGDSKDDEKYHSGLWRVNQQGEFVQNYFQYNITLPLVFNFYNSSFQILPNNEILLIDAVHGDLYICNNNTVERIVNYDIKDNKHTQNIEKKTAVDNNAKCNVCYGKKNYLISVWNDEKGERFYVIHDKKNKSTVFVDKFLNDDIITPFIMSYIIDNNSDDIISLSMDIDYLKSIILEDGVSADQRQRMQDLILEFNNEGDGAICTILELIYLK